MRALHRRRRPARREAVALEQAQRQPPRRSRPLVVDVSRINERQLRDRIFDRRRIIEREASTGFCSRTHCSIVSFEAVHLLCALSRRPRRPGGRGDAAQPRRRCAPRAIEVVHDIEHDRHGRCHFQQLRRQIEPVLEMGGVDDIDDEVGFAGENIVARDPLVDGRRIVMRVQRMDSRQVDDTDSAGPRSRTRRPSSRR